MKPAGMLRPGKNVTALRFTADGRRLITSGRTKMLQIWDMKTGKLLRSSKPQKRPIPTFDVSPDQKLIAAVISDWGKPSSAEITLFRLADLSEVKVVVSHPQQLKSADFSPDGRFPLRCGLRPN